VSATGLQCQVVWRSAFVLVFFLFPAYIDQVQVNLHDILPPARRTAVIPLTILLLGYGYRLGEELVGAKKGLARWGLLALWLLPAMVVATCMLVVLGAQGEVWVVRIVTLLMLASVLCSTIWFLVEAEAAAPLLALADLAYVGSVFLAALCRHYQQWTDLAVLTLGEFEGVQFWAPLGAFLLLLLNVSLYIKVAQSSPGRRVSIPPAT
jgi:hypothetical protein